MICATCAPESEKVKTERMPHRRQHHVLVLSVDRLDE